MTTKKAPKAKAKKKTPKPKTYVVMILDESGSMYSCQGAARNHFNEQVQAIKDTSKGQTVRASMVKFNGNVNELYFNKPLKELNELGTRDYSPRGSTALYDAMGFTMIKMGKTLKDLDKEHVSVLFVVVSDGEENSSKEFGGEHGRERLQEMIDTRQKTDRWTFTYMGANQDITKVAKDLGIHRANTTTFNTRDFRDATRRSRASIGNYMTSRGLGKKSVKTFYDSSKNKSK
jgi:uncharacterized protein YegL